jgi:hypothetical protein
MNGLGERQPEGPGDDWARYGGARRASADEREELLREDPFAEYRHENGSSGAAQSAAGEGRVRSKANLLGALAALAILAGTAVLLNTLSLNSEPRPSPAPRPTASLATPPLTLPRPILELARVGVRVSLPIQIFVPERATSPDDGTTMYLAGSAGAFAVDVGTGEAGTVWGGAGFPKDVRRLIYDDGLWLSAWPSDAVSCGPPCWDQATTLRIDPGSGKVTLRLAGTFLAGATFAGVYVASAGRLRAVDPTDGHELSSVAWKTAGEPRLGCESLWSVELGPANTLVRPINATTGDAVGSASTILDKSYTYGPTSVEGLCWMMSGSGGASVGATRLTMLSPTGSAVQQVDYASSMVILNGEFWILGPDDTIQRFEAASAALGYGQRFKLPVLPQDGDPRWIFSSVGTMWLYSGNQLVGFNIATGSSNVQSP